MKTSFRFVNFTNKKRLFNGHTRHWSKICVLCWKRKRNILYHFKKYHPKYYKSTIKLLQNCLGKGEIGVINGFRFVESSNVLPEKTSLDESV